MALENGGCGAASTTSSATVKASHTKLQPWKQFFPLEAAPKTAEENPDLSRPWLTWKPDPAKPDEKPWLKWMNDEKYNLNVNEKQRSQPEVEELRGRLVAYPTRKRSGSTQATIAEGG
ncbi:hypothetical protein GGS24DRAFT_514258 [Hypoxylon argillaceum]|nr:hypothetical protein GGS24DRAFT_514258 [Hypoxylon argillaceum]